MKFYICKCHGMALWLHFLYSLPKLKILNKVKITCCVKTNFRLFHLYQNSFYHCDKLAVGKLSWPIFTTFSKRLVTPTSSSKISPEGIKSPNSLVSPLFLRSACSELNTPLVLYFASVWNKVGGVSLCKAKIYLQHFSMLIEIKLWVLQADSGSLA